MPSPLTPAEFDASMARLGPFEAAPRLAVAVSGGADSMALALLAADWAAARGGSVVALTVDHGLRPGSGAEAAEVGGRLAALGIAHEVLHWEGPKPAADLQAAAREARYRLLGDRCRAGGVLHLLLAHHRDDQAETLLLRLGRGSGVDGLAAMAPVQETPWGRLLRPLLGVARERLAATLAARGQGWTEDPSNANAAFARVRLRRLLPVLAAEGLTPARLAATAGRLGRARTALEAALSEAALHTVVLHPAGFARLDPAGFARLPAEVRLRLLSRLLRAVGGGNYAPRLERLERLAADLMGGLGGARTLAGCRVAPDRGAILVCREAARLAPPVALAPGAEIRWDGRFLVRVAADAPSGLALGALGPRGWRQMAARMDAPLSVPAAARPSLPALYDQDGVSAVPHLGYNLAMVRRTLLSMVPSPAVPLTVAGHCLV